MITKAPIDCPHAAAVIAERFRFDPKDARIEWEQLKDDRFCIGGQFVQCPKFIKKRATP